MTRFKQLSNASLADQARDNIRTAILEGKIKPGEKITIERIAAELGISRTPVREALKALETDSMVRLVPHRGAVVEPLAWQEIQHRYVIRSMLEGYAAELACRAADDDLVAALNRNCDRLAKLITTVKSSKANFNPLVELNHEFHKLIRDGSKSPTLVRMIDTLRQPSSFSEFFWAIPRYRKLSLSYHRQITAAFRSRNAKQARDLTVRHITVAGEMVAKAAAPKIISLVAAD